MLESKCGYGGTGRRVTLRSLWEQSRGGSSPLNRTIISLTKINFIVMQNEIYIRKTKNIDLDTLENLYHEAFEGEDLFPLVTELLNDDKNTIHLSALVNDKLVGHITFTKCSILEENLALALLGPMAVFPSYQKQGIGTKLVQMGLEIIKEEGIYKVLVLGAPAFYGRYGFSEEKYITTPYPLPQEWKSAWQSILLLEDLKKPIAGNLIVTNPWRRQELWSE